MIDSRNLLLKQLTKEQLSELGQQIQDEMNSRELKQQGEFITQSANNLFSSSSKNQPNKSEYILARELLADVDKAKYDDIRKRWMEYPRLMFIEIKAANGETTSPLKRALANLDTYTWKPFYEWIQKNQPDMVPEFLKQNAEAENQIILEDMQRLVKATEDYVKQLENWKLKNINDNKLKKHFQRFIKIQFETLRWHMLREMCRKKGKETWKENSNFNNLSAPTKCVKVLDYSTVKMVEIDSADFVAHFGSCIGIVRGDSEELKGIVANVRHARVFIGYLNEDAKCLSQLINVRASERASIPAPAKKKQMRL